MGHSRPLAGLVQDHACVAARAVRLVVAHDPAYVREERWEPPDSSRPLVDMGGGERYESSVEEGEHGLFVGECAGPFVLAGLRPDSPARFLADAGRTKGRCPVFGEYASAPQTV